MNAIAPVAYKTPYSSVSYNVSFTGNANYIFVKRSDGAVSSYSVTSNAPLIITQWLVNIGITGFEFSAAATPDTVYVI